MYVAREYDEILKELQTQSANPESKIEGTFGYDMLSANAIEFSKVESEIAQAYVDFFTPTDEYLDMRAAEFGIYRRAGTKSKGTVTITGSGTINKGALFTTLNGVQFIATKDAVIDGVGTVEIEAQISGTTGNVAAGTITKIPLSIPGVQSVVNENPTVDGFDEETNEDLRERLFFKVRYPSTSGNPNHYIQWSLEVSGVGAASVIRCFNGRGTVLVLIVDEDFNPAGAELVKRVYEHIEIERPIGVEVTVQAAEPVDVDVVCDIVGVLDVETFRKTIKAYFKRLMMSRFINYTAVNTYEEIADMPAGIVSRSMIGNAIISCGATDYDYDSMRLNGVANDIELTVSQIPRLNKILFRQLIRE